MIVYFDYKAPAQRLILLPYLLRMRKNQLYVCIPDKLPFICLDITLVRESSCYVFSMFLHPIQTIIYIYGYRRLPTQYP